MSRDLISKKTRYELREYFVGTTLREIEMEFDVVDIDCNLNFESPVAGQRRALVEQYYSTLDFSNPKDVQKFLNLYENILLGLEEQITNIPFPSNSNDWVKSSYESLKKWISKDDFSYKEGKLVSKMNNVSFEEIVSPLHQINSEYLATQLRRINDSIDTDVTLAVGSAKELIETISKTILDERSVTYSNNDNVGELVKKVRKTLRILPEDIDDKAKGAKSIKVLLSNLGNIAQVMAELRNLYGTGHGKSGKTPVGLTQRHARLAVGAASTLVTFLYETHLERNT